MPSRTRKPSAKKTQAKGGMEVPPAHQPGTTGHPTRQRGREIEQVDMSEVARTANEGAHTGSSRSVHIHRPNRKHRVA